MTLSNATATTGISATATATGPGVTWRERIGGAASITALPLATTGYECSGTLGAVGNVLALSIGAGSATVDGIGAAASGSITYGVPVNGDTVIVNGTTFTKAAAGAAAAFSSISELEVLIEALTGINSSQNGTAISITAESVGTAGNAITLAFGTNTGTMSKSGATLTGGINASTLVGGDGKNIEGVTLTTLVKAMAVRIECTSGGFTVDKSTIITSMSIGADGVFEFIVPAGTTEFLATDLTLTSTVADSAFTVTVLGSIV